MTRTPQKQPTAAAGAKYDGVPSIGEAYGRRGERLAGGLLKGSIENGGGDDRYKPRYYACREETAHRNPYR